MKKLFGGCLALLLAVGLLLYAGGAAYKQTNDYRDLERKDDTEKFHDMPETIDVAVFGASHGREDFKFAPEGASQFNFSLSLQTPDYDLRLMREYQDRIRPGALVILAISPIFPFYVQPEETFAEQQSRYYRICSPENIIDVDLGLWLRTRFSPLLTEDFAQIVSAFTQEAELVGTIDERSGHDQITPEVAAGRKPRVFDLQIAYVQGFPEANATAMESYRAMLDMCREKRWRAVLAMPPYLKEYTDCFTEFAPDYFDVMTAEFDALARDYGTVYLDYSREPAYDGRYDFYRDMSHMNLAGAEVFDTQFYQDLRALGIWP